MQRRTSTDRFRRSTPRTSRALRQGFTLLEVIVAVTIIAILAALLVPNVLGFIGSSKMRVAKAGVNALSQQVRLYCADHEMSKPDRNFDLTMLLEGSKPYLNNDQDLLDPWGNPFVLVVPGQVNFDFDIVSYGADGAPGGEGEDADIISGAK
jgi:general secretion pathway protein G